MSGICAVWRKQDPERTARTLASVSRGLSLADSERVELATAAGAGVGVSSRFRTQQIYQNPHVLIACDADLYNQDELADWAGDTEPAPGNAKTAAQLAALYERFGTAFVDKLRGAFSVIVWDQREKKLVGAVDGFGIHRLVYYEDAHVLLVASRIDALLESGSIEREINPRAIANVLNCGASLAPETIFRTVRRIPPGTMLVATEEHTHSHQYWDMRYGVETGLNEAGLSRKLEALVEESVAAHYKTDSPAMAGAFLSGGTDSSTVVGMMARAGRGEVHTFSIGFQEQPFNELHYAEIAAQRFHAKHHTYLVGADDCFAALPQMVRCFDEPFGNSSAIPTYFCARLAVQNGIQVLLAGDGGDELFAGNEWYGSDKIFALYHRVPALLRKRLIEPVLAGLPFNGGVVRKARNYVRRANLPGLDRVMSYHFLRAHDPAEVLEGDFLQTLGDYSVLEVPTRYYEHGPAREHLDRVLYTDVKTILGDSDLPKVTRMSELAGIQARFPFLARPVAEFSGCIPVRLKVKGFQKRYLFKRAFRNLLPAEIIQKKKHGFGIPVATWLKSDPRMRELARDTLLARRAFERGYFRRDFIEGLFRKHESDNTSYYGDTLWTFLALELWHRQFVDEPLRVTA